MGEFTSCDHYIYYCQLESLRRNGVAIIVNKSPKCSTWAQSQNLQNDISSFPRQTIQHYNNQSLCPNHGCWRSWSWSALWRPIRPSTTNTQKRCPLHHRGLECKSRMSRDTWRNSQVCPWSTQWSRAKVNRILPREHTGHSKHPLPITQEMALHMDITRWSILKSDWLFSLQSKMKKLYTVGQNKTWNLLWLRASAPIAKFRLKLKKIGKATRPFR